MHQRINISMNENISEMTDLKGKHNSVKNKEWTTTIFIQYEMRMRLSKCVWYFLCDICDGITCIVCVFKDSNVESYVTLKCLAYSIDVKVRHDAPVKSS